MVFGALPAAAETAHIAVATNFKLVVDELKPVFEAETGHQLVISAGSTGKIYAQIRNGAPYDLFLSADSATPARLAAEGRADATSQMTYAIGQLALWSRKDRELSFDLLASGDLRRVAMANPRLAPYGAAAKQFLTGADLFGMVEPKLVYGENVGQTFAFVRTRNAELGFVALSQILAQPESRRGAYLSVPAESHAEIRQDAIRLTQADGNKAANAFLEFLASDEAQMRIVAAGYKSRQ